MAKLKIIKAPDQRLKLKATKVENFDKNLENFANDMIDTCKLEQNSAALASIQVEDDTRFSYSKVQDGFRPQPNIIVFIHDKEEVAVNPEIIEYGKETAINEEGCLSIPNLPVPVKRSLKIKVKFQDLSGKEYIKNLEGFESICYQHELDHQYGIITIDRADPIKRILLWKKYEQMSRLLRYSR